MIKYKIYNIYSDNAYSAKLNTLSEAIRIINDMSLIQRRQYVISIQNDGFPLYGREIVFWHELSNLS